MNKRNAAAAAAAANGEQEGTSPPSTADDDHGAGASGAGMFTLPSTASGGAGERLRNPFADYEDDEDDDEHSGSGSDDGEVEAMEGAGSAGNAAWERGSWWRGVVRSARRGTGGRHEVERFGDGRDDDSSSEEEGPVGRRRVRDQDDEEEEGEDEEFGDFAMPEVEERVGGAVSGIDPARESVLVKPTAVHPPSSTLKSSAIGPFSSLWPFSREKKEGEQAGGEGSTAAGGSGADPAAAGVITEEPVELTREDEEAMISEDGKRIDRAVEATRRTSIEDPDEDEVDLGEDIVVHRAAGGR